VCETFENHFLTNIRDSGTSAIVEPFELRVRDHNMMDMSPQKVSGFVL